MKLTFTNTSETHVQIWRNDEQIASFEVTPGNVKFVVTSYGMATKLDFDEYEQIYKKFKELREKFKGGGSFDSIRGKL